MEAEDILIEWKERRNREERRRSFLNHLSTQSRRTGKGQEILR